jgi:hypothetical protein
MDLKYFITIEMNSLYNINDPSYFNLEKFKKITSKNLKNINESKKVYNNLPNIDRKIINSYTHNTDMSDLIELLDDKRYNDILSYRILKYITGYHDVPSNAHMLHFIESYINRKNKSKILSKIQQLITINYHGVIKLIQSLDSWKYISSNDITVYTGFKFEIPDITLANDTKYQNAMINMINTEKRFIIPFFLSTTISPYVAKRFAGNGLVLKINIPKGNKFAYISSNNSKELEVLLNCGAILEKNETLNESIDNMIEVTLIGYEEKNERYYERLRDNYYNIIRKINSISNSQGLQTRSKKRLRNLQTRSKKDLRN